MGRIAITRHVKAPLAKVFDAIAHIESFQQIVPEIVDVEFLTEQKRGVGTRFRETRKMGKHSAATELEVTEYVENEHVRLVSDAGGTIWDTVFRVKPHAGADGEVELEMVMEDKPYKLKSRLFVPLIRGMVRKHVERDMDAVKVFCEQG